ncbi:MAG: hypothetical protein IT285_00675 [Bdellovibrionales bacterium]|nr:hypothetical protein [Bdellovibrionales bacterium]
MRSEITATMGSYAEALPLRGGLARRRWKAALSLLAEPDLGMFLVVCLTLLGLALHREAFEARQVFLAALSSVSAAAFGGLMAWRWRQRVERSMAVERGRGAVSNLKLLLTLVTRTEARLRGYLSRQSGLESDASFYIEESLVKLGFLAENTIRALEAWADLVPEADVRSLMRRANELRRRISEVEGLRAKVEAEMRSTQSSGPGEPLIHELASTQEELEKLRSEIAACDAKLSEFFDGGRLLS